MGKTIKKGEKTKGIGSFRQEGLKRLVGRETGGLWRQEGVDASLEDVLFILYPFQWLLASN